MAVIYALTIFILRLIYRRNLAAHSERQKSIMELDEWVEIRDPSLLKPCLWVLGLTVTGFVLHQYVHLESFKRAGFEEAFGAKGKRARAPELHFAHLPQEVA